MGSTRLEIKLGPCYFESRNRCTAGMPPGGPRGARAAPAGARAPTRHGARAQGGARAPPGGADVRKGRTRKKPEGVQQYIYTRVIPQACFRIGPPLSSLFACAFRRASSGFTLRRGGGRRHVPWWLVRSSFIGPPLSSLLRVPSGASSGVTPRRGDGRRPVSGCVVASVT